MSNTYKLKEDIQEMYKCFICQNVMKDPVTLLCGHSGCMVCLRRVKTTSSTPHCPVCRMGFRAQNLRTNVALRDIIGEISVRCFQKDCYWEGKLSDNERHARECVFVTVTCTNEGCSYRDSRGAVQEHKKSCPRRKVACPQCKLEMPSFSLDEHVKGSCPLTKISCNLGCGKTIPSDYMFLHYGQCPQRAVLCAVPGCCRIVKRGDVENHDVTHGATHKRLLMAENAHLLTSFFNKTANNEEIETVERSVNAFRWEVENFKGRVANAMEAGKALLMASPNFCTPNSVWRVVIEKSCLQSEPKLYFNLISSSGPVTVNLRAIFLKDDTVSKQERAEHVTLSEGEVFEMCISQLEEQVEEGGMLTIKVVIETLQLLLQRKN